MSRQWSRSEVWAEARREDGGVTMVVDNEVYSVPGTFLDEHPGGHEVLLGVAGKDASEQFHDVGHSADARELMAQYRAGSVRHSERAPVRSHRPVPPSQPAAAEGMHWSVPLALAAAVSALYYCVAP